MSDSIEDYEIYLKSKCKSELEEILVSIDKDKYPERYEIAKKYHSEIPTEEKVGSDEIEFARFSQRLSAKIIDGFVCLPFGLLVMFVSLVIKTDVVLIIILYYALAFLILFYITYFLAKFGATIGKSNQKIMVINVNKKSIGWYESILRNVPDYFYQVINLFAAISVISILQNNSNLNMFTSLGLIRKSQSAFFNLFDFLFSVWIIADIIVYFANKNKRSLHDLIAGTIVIERESIIKFRGDL